VTIARDAWRQPRQGSPLPRAVSSSEHQRSFRRSGHLNLPRHAPPDRCRCRLRPTRRRQSRRRRPAARAPVHVNTLRIDPHGRFAAPRHRRALSRKSSVRSSPMKPSGHGLGSRTSSPFAHAGRAMPLLKLVLAREAPTGRRSMPGRLERDHRRWPWRSPPAYSSDASHSCRSHASEAC
jgi:hypothetical protein